MIYFDSCIPAWAKALDPRKVSLPAVAAIRKHSPPPHAFRPIQNERREYREHCEHYSSKSLSTPSATLLVQMAWAQAPDNHWTRQPSPDIPSGLAPLLCWRPRRVRRECSFAFALVCARGWLNCSPGTPVLRIPRSEELRLSPPALWFLVTITDSSCAFWHGGIRVAK